MNLKVKRPIPLYGKLLLENKILLFFGWIQVAGMAGGPLVVVVLAGAIWYWRRRKRQKVVPPNTENSSPT